MGNYIAGLVSLSLSAGQFWLLVLLALTAGAYAATSASRRHAEDNGLPYAPMNIMRAATPAAFVLLGATVFAFDWAGTASLLLAPVLAGVVLILGDTLARNSAARKGYYAGGGINAIIGRHIPLPALAGVLAAWTIAILFGFTYISSVAVALILPVVATRRAITDAQSKARNYGATASALAVILSVPESALNLGDWTGDLGSGLEMTRVPAAAALKAEQIADRLAQIAPHLSVVEASMQRVVLAPATAEDLAARQLAAETGGLITDIGGQGGHSNPSADWDDSGEAL